MYRVSCLNAYMYLNKVLFIIINKLLLKALIVDALLQGGLPWKHVRPFPGFSTFYMDQLGKIRRHHWKERL